MSETEKPIAFTPGPWEAMPHGRVAGSRTVELVGGTVRTQVAMATANEMTPEEQQANAHLMSAAPDLYEALDRIVQLWRTPASDSLVSRMIAEHAMAPAMEALAKARGVSK